MYQSITLFSMAAAIDAQIYDVEDKQQSQKDSAYIHYLKGQLAHYRAEAQSAQNRERVLKELKEEIKKIQRMGNIQWAYKQEIQRIEYIIRREKEEKKRIAKIEAKSATEFTF